MRAVRRHIAERQSELARHPFFGRLDAASSADEAAAFASELTFWVMSFQDVLRLNERLAVDPALLPILRHHRIEDSGHERWFLDDLTRLDQPIADLRELFGPRHASTRDAAYALVSEVFRARDDRARVVLLLSLESAGHVFFGRMADAIARVGWSSRLRYFSHSHLDVEKNHALFEAALDRQIDAIALTNEARCEAVAVVDRCYGAFDAMFSGFSMPLASPLSIAG